MSFFLDGFNPIFKLLGFFDDQSIIFVLTVAMSSFLTSVIKKKSSLSLSNNPNSTKIILRQEKVISSFFNYIKYLFSFFGVGGWNPSIKSPS